MRKNNYPLPDALESTSSVVSSHDFTGLVPSGIETEDEQIAYKGMYKSTPDIR